MFTKKRPKLPANFTPGRKALAEAAEQPQIQKLAAQGTKLAVQGTKFAVQGAAKATRAADRVIKETKGQNLSTATKTVAGMATDTAMEGAKKSNILTNADADTFTTSAKRTAKWTGDTLQAKNDAVLPGTYTENIDYINLKLNDLLENGKVMSRVGLDLLMSPLRLCETVSPIPGPIRTSCLLGRVAINSVSNGLKKMEDKKKELKEKMEQMKKGCPAQGVVASGGSKKRKRKRKRKTKTRKKYTKPRKTKKYKHKRRKYTRYRKRR